MAPRILWVSTPILAKYSGQVIAETGTLLEVTREPLGQLLCARLSLGPQHHGRVEVFLAEDLPDLLTFGPDFRAECRLIARRTLVATVGGSVGQTAPFDGAGLLRRRKEPS